MRKQDTIGDFGIDVVFSWVNFSCRYFHLNILRCFSWRNKGEIVWGHLGRWHIKISSCRSKGILNHDREMEIHVDSEGSSTYLPLEGKDEVQVISIMKSWRHNKKERNLTSIHYNEVSCHSFQIMAFQSVTRKFLCHSCIFPQIV